MADSATPLRAVAVMRGMVAALIIAYAATVYLELRPPTLAIEATEYRRLVWLSVSGFDLKFALQKLCFICGNCLGLFGAVLMGARRRLGLTLLCAGPPLLGVAMLLGAATPAYPDVEEAITLLLWCMTSALFGSVVVYTLLRREVIFK